MMALLRRSARAALLGAVLALPACRPSPEPAEPSVLSDWMSSHFAIARAERLSPLITARLSAYSAVALYEGVASGSRELRSLAGQLPGLDSLPTPEPGVALDRATVAIRAQATVLRRLVPDASPSAQSAIASLERTQLAQRLAAGVDSAMQAASLAYGEQVGEAIAAWAARDGFTDTRTLAWVPPEGEQYWTGTGSAEYFTPQSLSAATDMVAMADPTASLDPGIATERALVMNRPKRKGATTIAGANVMKPLEPFWGRLRTFAIDSGGACAPPPPPEYSRDTTSRFYREAREVYEAGRALDDSQRTIGLFWADNPGQTGTPPAHWTSIMGQLVHSLQLDLDRTAEMYVLTALGQADAFVATWHTKYRWNVMRPVTYINRHIDPDWRPLIVTPPFPEYTSGHSVQSGAAAEILTRLLGDSVSFTDSTATTLGHAPRHYRSFHEAAREVAISRLYAGVHYRSANENGLAQGKCVAEQVSRLRTRKAG